MGDYVDKLENMIENGFNMQEVAENIYLNYHAAFHTDEVYLLRKAISNKFNCNLNDVKLIGSAHTGYTFKTGSLEKRDEPNDYDFAIINADVFIKYFHKVDCENMSPKMLKTYKKRILRGKIHPYYTDDAFQEELESINKSIMESLSIDKHVSVCFYLSERDFIDGLVDYNRQLYALILQKKADSIDKTSIISGCKPVEKMED